MGFFLDTEGNRAITSGGLQIGGQVGSTGSNVQLDAQDGTHEGGDILFKGATGTDWHLDSFDATMRLHTGGTVYFTLSATLMKFPSAVTLQFGTFTTDASPTITGHITINDAGGTARKLAVIA